MRYDIYVRIENEDMLPYPFHYYTKIDNEEHEVFHIKDCRYHYATESGKHFCDFEGVDNCTREFIVDEIDITQCEQCPMKRK